MSLIRLQNISRVTRWDGDNPCIAGRFAGDWAREYVAIMGPSGRENDHDELLGCLDTQRRAVRAERRERERDG